LVGIHGGYQINKQRKNSKENFLKRIRVLNEEMDQLTFALDEYIFREQNKVDFGIGGPATNILHKFNSPINQSDHNSNRISDRVPEKVLIANFNYTNIISRQIHPANYSNVHHIHIHGEAGNENHPIIFGYGDDTDDEYRNLEKSGEDEFLMKIKAFQYPSTSHYHQLLDFIEDQKFDVFVVGHSCGLSDRTLLKTIFEHNNCVAIKNFHYKTLENEAREEDFYKRLAISRHFEDKVKMRDRLLPFDANARLYQVN